MAAPPCQRGLVGVASVQGRRTEERPPAPPAPAAGAFHTGRRCCLAPERARKGGRPSDEDYPTPKLRPPNPRLGYSGTPGHRDETDRQEALDADASVQQLRFKKHQL